MNIASEGIRVFCNPEKYTCKNQESKRLWGKKGTVQKVYENDMLGVLFDGDNVPRMVWRDSVDIIKEKTIAIPQSDEMDEQTFTDMMKPY